MVQCIRIYVWEGKIVLTRAHRLTSVAIVEFGLIATNHLFTNPVANFMLLFATAVGASLPDIDEYNSSASRKSIINFSLFLRHRGITHSLIGFLVFAGGLYYLMNKLMPIQFKSFTLLNYWTALWLGLVIGYFLHLIEDSFSHQGVDWLAPFLRSKKKRILLHYKVGGIFEQIITLIAYVSIILMSLYWVWNLIHSPAKI